MATTVPLTVTSSLPSVTSLSSSSESSSSSPTSSSSSGTVYLPNLRCSCNRYSSLSSLFFCASCTSVKCTHPSCTVETIENGICQRCLRISSPQDILQRKVCPCSQSLLASSASSASIPWETLTASLKQSSLYQQYLLPSVYPRASLIPNPTAPTPTARATNVSPIPSDNSSTNEINISPYLGTGLDVSPLNASSSSISPVVSSSSSPSSSSTNTSPSGILAPSFLSLCQRRCRSCLQNNQSGLLVSTHPNPFATLVNAPSLSTVSSNNNNNTPATTTWSPSSLYRKYVAFGSVVPSCSLQILPPFSSSSSSLSALAEHGIRYGTLRIRNPAPYPMILALPSLPSAFSYLFPISSSSSSTVMEEATKIYHRLSVPSSLTNPEQTSAPSSVLYFYIPGTIIDNEDIMDIELSEIYTRIQNDFQHETQKSYPSAGGWLPFPSSSSSETVSYLLPGSAYHVHPSSTVTPIPSSSTERIKAAIVGDISIGYSFPSVSHSKNFSTDRSNDDDDDDRKTYGNGNRLALPFTYTVYLHPQTIMEHGGLSNTTDKNNQVTKLSLLGEWLLE